jgi:hypothetical protein
MTRLFHVLHLDPNHKEQLLKNFAVYAATVTVDSPMGNGNNYLWAATGDGKGWKIVQVRLLQCYGSMLKLTLTQYNGAEV